MGGPPYSIDRDRKSKSHQAPKCKKRTGVESWSETKKERQSQPVWSVFASRGAPCRDVIDERRAHCSATLVDHRRPRSGSFR